MLPLLSRCRSLPLRLALVLLAGAVGSGVVIPPAATAVGSGGRLSGRVFDTGAAPLTVATVRATDRATGTAVQTTADRDGRYSLTLPEGPWTSASPAP